MVSPHISILNIPISAVTRQEAVKLFLEHCISKKNSSIFSSTPNAEILLESRKNKKLSSYLKNCDLNLADSVSLLWAGMVQECRWSNFRAVIELVFLPFRKNGWKKTFPEQICGSDFFLDVCEVINKDKNPDNFSIFLLGGGNGIARKTKMQLQSDFPNLKIVGAMAGSPKPSFDKSIIKKINNVAPRLIFIAYGCPKQELWIARNLKKCKTVKIAMGIGGTFDFVSGKVKRAPKWMRSIGFEWMWRYILQPSRYKRIFSAVFVFPYIFLRNRKKN